MHGCGSVPSPAISLDVSTTITNLLQRAGQSVGVFGGVGSSAAAASSTSPVASTQLPAGTGSPEGVAEQRSHVAQECGLAHSRRALREGGDSRSSELSSCRLTFPAGHQVSAGHQWHSGLGAASDAALGARCAAPHQQEQGGQGCLLPAARPGILRIGVPLGQGVQHIQQNASRPCGRSSGAGSRGLGTLQSSGRCVGKQQSS